MATATGTPTGPIGADWNPFTPDELANPYPFYDRARAEAPVFHSPLLDMWVVTRYGDVVAALENPKTFSSANTAPSEGAAQVGQMLYPGPNAVSVDPPAHDRLRPPLDPSFSPPRLALMEDQIRGIAHELVDAMSAGSSADLVSGLASPLPLRMVMALFGAPPERFADFQRWANALISFMTTPMTPDQMAMAGQDIAEYHNFMLNLIAEKRAHPGTDITSDLVGHDGGPPLSDGELLSTLTGLTFAGHPTIMCLIGNAAMLFQDERSRWEALADDPSGVPSALEEALRLTAPVPSVIRRVTEDAVVGPATIPAGSLALLISNSANRDEAEFSSPNDYMPGRPHGSHHLTFAGGPHYCAGRALARLEARIAYEVLLDRLPGLRIVEGQTFEYLPTLVIRGVRSIAVEWD